MSSKIFCKSWGAEYIAADVVRFRLWATGQQKVMLRLAGKDQEMQASGDGWFTLDVSGVTPGTEYNFVLSDGMVLPDPASRAQKTDVNGPSYVIAPGFIAVSWRFPGGTLSLALNISATTVLLPDLPGKTLFAWPNESTGSLSQHSLIVRLAQGESAS